MEKREGNVSAALLAVIAILLAAVICGASYLGLYRPLLKQQVQLAAMQAELGKLEAVRAQVSDAQAALRDSRTELDQLKASADMTLTDLAQLGSALRENSSKLAEIKSELGRVEAAARGRSGGMRGTWTADQAAAADSVEGQLRSQGKHWVRTTGEFAVGSYVEDMLGGRLNQPLGRGAIGKVAALTENESGAPCAQVDFGRGHVAGIMLKELSLIQFVPEASK
jgi:hypothetical protein